MYSPIKNYGIIGDLHTCALINLNGSMDWSCFPYFDSPSTFAKILDHQIGGFFQLVPENYLSSHSEYIENTTTLVTQFKTDHGVIELIDLMPIEEVSGHRKNQDHYYIFRKIISKSSKDEKINLSFHPKINYGQVTPTMTHLENQILSDDFSLFFDQQLTWTDHEEAYLNLAPHQCSYFVLTNNPNFKINSIQNFIEENIKTTHQFWQNWLKQSNYQGKYTKTINRSLLTLKLLCFHLNGAILAAPTTSLPEGIGGERNWDYRFSWVRDSSFVASSFIKLGFYQEAKSFIQWMHNQVITKGEYLKILYPLRVTSKVEETRLDYLDGYQSSKPVRIGNAAYFQTQVDIYGEFLHMIWNYFSESNDLNSELVKLVDYLVEQIELHWNQTDEGIWEIRDTARHFTHSKLMCWVGIRDAMKIYQQLNLNRDFKKLTLLQNEIKDFILNHNIQDNYFTQHNKTKAVDASLLNIILYDFIDDQKDLTQNTIDKIIKELSRNHCIDRYHTADGLCGDEGSFHLCTFWLIQALCKIGNRNLAQKYFDQMLTFKNHLELYSEEIDATTGEFLGNFPQAFSHLGLIDTILEIENE